MVHESYHSFGIGRVDLRAPTNETIHDVRRIGFGGLLQNLITGPRVYNLEQMLYTELRNALEDKGYEVTLGLSMGETDYRQPQEAKSPDFDAVMYTTITRFTPPSSSPPPRLRITLEGELRVAGSATLAYSVEDTVDVRGTVRDSQGRFLEAGIRGVARRLVMDLPDLKR
ncbi:MAG: hypothetical protein AAF488_05475 [Planctomycetota bacterium]